MPIMPNITPYLSALLFAVTGCAQQPIKELKNTEASEVDLNSFAFWKNKVDTNSCSGDFNAPDERLIKIFNLSNEHKLLQVACDFGAYQDSHRSYLINSHGAILKPAILNTPVNEELNKLNPSNTVWGSFSLTDNSTLELLYLSAGSGACGYRAIYSISTLLEDGRAIPTSIYGDTNCYNGNLVPNWPLIKLER